MTFIKPATNPFKGAGYEFESLFNNLVSIKEIVDNQAKKSLAVVGLADGGKFSLLASVPSIVLPSARDIRYGSNYYSKSPVKSIEETEKICLTHAKAASDILQGIVEQNKEVEVKNLEIKNNLVALMEKIGIPQTYVTYEYPTSRSKTSKKVTHTAGYLKDIEKILPKSNTYDVKRRIEEYISSLNRIFRS
jgi:hypothetical protein